MNIQPLATSALSGIEDRPIPPAKAAGRSDAVGKTQPEDGIKPSYGDVSAAVKKMNDAMLGSSQSLQFSIDEDSKDLVVKVIDQNTKEVLRQMPSKEALQIAKSIDKMMEKMHQGLLINQKA
jgi:flagellar protein FlaG